MCVIVRTSHRRTSLHPNGPRGERKLHINIYYLTISFSSYFEGKIESAGLVCVFRLDSSKVIEHSVLAMWSSCGAQSLRFILLCCKQSNCSDELHCGFTPSSSPDCLTCTRFPASGLIGTNVWFK